MVVDEMFIQQFDPFDGIRELIPMIIFVSLGVLAILLLLVLVSAIARWRAQKATVQMQKDITAIRELLESEIKLRTYGRPTAQPQETHNDPQVPPQP